jgi:hypothetical protein
MLWLVYTGATLLRSLPVPAIYVKAYDGNGHTERLQAIGRFTQWAIRIISGPLGLPLGAMTNGPVERIFGCEESDEVCGVLIEWWTQFASLLVQVFLLRWLAQRAI